MSFTRCYRFEPTGKTIYCPDCAATGRTAQLWAGETKVRIGDCDRCKGTGLAPEFRKIEISDDCHIDI
jgi:hypothetical protein